MKNTFYLYFALLLTIFINASAKDEKITLPQPNPAIKILYTIPGAESQENSKIFEIKSTAELKIDGIFDEQVKTHPLIIRDGKSSIIARIYFSYNNNGIYLFAHVIDKSPSLNKNTKEKINNGDSIELLFEFERVYHIGIKTTEKKELWNWTLRSNIDRDNTYFKRTKNGYIIEAQIPWHNFMMGCLCSLRNKELNFNVIINNRTWNNKIIKYKWCNGDEDEDEDKEPRGCGHVVFR